MSDDQEVNQLRAKLEQQATQFESYKEECKHIEEMLEEECHKKESEIKQLKEEAIKRQKGEKILKVQVSQLEAEVANLKVVNVQNPQTQVGIPSQAQSQQAKYKEELAAITKQNASLKQAINALESKLSESGSIKIQLQSQLISVHSVVEELKKALAQSEFRAKSLTTQTQTQSSPWKDTNKNDQELKKLSSKVSSLEKEKAKLQKSLKEKEQEGEKARQDLQEKVKKLQHQLSAKGKNQEQKATKRQQSEVKQPKQTMALSEHKLQMAKLKQSLLHYQERAQKLQLSDKELKIKLTLVMNEKTALLFKYKKLFQQLEIEKQKHQNSFHSSSPQKVSSQQIMIDDGFNGSVIQLPNLRMDCLLVTKKHYISPFIQVKDNKLIKVYKSTKTGFEKSLGATRHKFDSVGYNSESIVKTGVELVKQSLSRGKSHSIVIYGSKRTDKKQLMGLMVQELREWLLEKVEEQKQHQSESKHQMRCQFMRRGMDCDECQQREAYDRQEIAQILDWVISLSTPQSPSKKSQGKNNQKPQVRYFCLSLNDSTRLQIITSSYLNPFVKNNETFVDYLNTVVFSKLPDVLQSAETNYHIVALVNPIVSEYEECKNTLSITMVPYSLPDQHDSQPMTSTMVYSPAAINKEYLNDLTKKKLQSFQKQTQQAGLKVRKSEDECNYLRGRFQELEVRLKNLINTHQQQNVYLKKSPVTLSYEKLLKFVNSVLARNSSIGRTSISPNFGLSSSQQDDHQHQVNMYIQQDAKSLDGY